MKMNIVHVLAYFISQIGDQYIIYDINEWNEVSLVQINTGASKLMHFSFVNFSSNQ